MLLENIYSVLGRFVVKAHTHESIRAGRACLGAGRASLRVVGLLNEIIEARIS